MRLTKYNKWWIY